GYDRTPFFNGLFWNFHPSYLSFTRPSFKLRGGSIAPVHICRQFMMRDSYDSHCETGRKCWRHQLKDMKIIKRDMIGSIGVEDEDRVMDVSTDTCKTIAEAKQIILVLTWN
ncbi:unnamed protein product, partial [Linum tenue]